MQEGGSPWGDSEGQVCTHTTRFSVSGLGRRGAEVLGGGGQRAAGEACQCDEKAGLSLFSVQDGQGGSV